MRRSVVYGGLLLLAMAGCTGQLQSRADTSAEQVPAAVDLSPAALLGKPGDSSNPPPKVEAEVGGGSGEKPQEVTGDEKK